MEMEVFFPGGRKVNSYYKGYRVETDQPEKEGGEGSAPEPYDLFLASIGTCAGIYVLSFCQERNIDTEKLKMSLHFQRNGKTQLLEEITIKVILPPDFPEKYKLPIIRTAELCTVKKSIDNPPQINISAEISG
jgi:ribosomal protein S12 methylthiotransferase accessory factor